MILENIPQTHDHYVLASSKVSKYCLLSFFSFTQAAHK